MSINGQYRQVSLRMVEQLQANPDLAYAALHWEPDAPAAGSDPLATFPVHLRAMLASLPQEDFAKALDEFRAGMGGMMLAPVEDDEVVFPGAVLKTDVAALQAAGIGGADLGEVLDIRKSWHPLHFLLSGQASEAPWPWGAVVLGGEEIGENLGYGPARLLTPSQVAELADALQALGEDALMARYVPAAFEAAGIAPCGWEDPDEDAERREWLLDTFREVRDYYVAARDRGYGMVLALV